MFSTINGLAILVYVLVLTFYGKKFGMNYGKSFIIGTGGMIVSYILIMVVTWIENGFKIFGAQNAVRVFVFMPPLILLFSKIFKVNYRSLCDYESGPSMLWFGLGHYACVFEGCCHGFQYYEGTTMYNISNALTGTNMFPSQFVESTLAVLTSIMLFVLANNKHFKGKGYTYFIMLIVYGIQRFILEFFRDNEKIVVFSEMETGDGVIGLSSLAFWALAMAIEGAVLLAIFVIKDKKKTKLEETSAVAA